MKAIVHTHAMKFWLKLKKGIGSDLVLAAFKEMLHFNNTTILSWNQ